MPTSTPQPTTSPLPAPSRVVSSDASVVRAQSLAAAAVAAAASASASNGILPTTTSTSHHHRHTSDARLSAAHYAMSLSTRSAKSMQTVALVSRDHAASLDEARVSCMTDAGLRNSRAIAAGAEAGTAAAAERTAAALAEEAAVSAVLTKGRADAAAAELDAAERRLSALSTAANTSAEAAREAFAAERTTALELQNAKKDATRAQHLAACTRSEAEAAADEAHTLALRLAAVQKEAMVCTRLASLEKSAAVVAGGRAVASERDAASATLHAQNARQNATTAAHHLKTSIAAEIALGGLASEAQFSVNRAKRSLERSEAHYMRAQSKEVEARLVKESGEQHVERVLGDEVVSLSVQRAREIVANSVARTAVEGAAVHASVARSLATEHSVSP